MHNLNRTGGTKSIKLDRPDDRTLHRSRMGTCYAAIRVHVVADLPVGGLTHVDVRIVQIVPVPGRG